MFLSGTLRKELDNSLTDLERLSNLVELSQRKEKEVLKQKSAQAHSQ